MCISGAHVTILDAKPAYVEDLRRDFTGKLTYNLNGERELKNALRDMENHDIEQADFHSYPLEANSLDAFCLSTVLDDPQTKDQDEVLLKGLVALKPGGKLVVGLYIPVKYDLKRVQRVASENGFKLTVIDDDIKYGEDAMEGAIFQLEEKPK